MRSQRPFPVPAVTAWTKLRPPELTGESQPYSDYPDDHVFTVAAALPHALRRLHANLPTLTAYRRFLIAHAGINQLTGSDQGLGGALHVCR